MLEFMPLPSEDADYRLAFRLVMQDPPLDREILEDLMGAPKRYGDLRRLLDGRNDNVLTKALARLRDEGAVHAGIDLESGDKLYGLMALGKLAILRMYQMLPHVESIRAYERGKSAA
jgi:DNA-binding HxlR family transcriptional regulator